MWVFAFESGVGVNAVELQRANTPMLDIYGPEEVSGPRKRDFGYWKWQTTQDRPSPDRT